MSAARAIACWLAFASAFLVTMRAEAHAVGLSQATYAVHGAAVDAQMTLARGEMLGAVPELDPAHGGTLSLRSSGASLDAASLDAARPALARVFAAGLEITRSGAACPVELLDVALADEDGLRLTLRATCPATAGGAPQVNVAFLEALSHGHRQIAKLGDREEVLFRDHSRFELAAGAATGERAAEAAAPSLLAFVRMGVEHILGGYDHLLFLFALILVGGRFRSVALVITAFTVAHSVSLAAAVLGLLAPSPRIVEPAIALSIAYVGVENFVVKDAKKRWRLTLFFGLIHGFGFAGALQEISLPRAQVPLALLGFNLGVEAGQLAVLAVVLPAVLWLRRRPTFRVHGVRVASAAVVVMGVVWFVERAFFAA